MDSIDERNLAVLESLQKKSYSLAILTSRTRGEVVHFLDSNHPLQKYISAFYHKDNSTYLKPDPRVFDGILAQFAYRPAQAVYVGDSVGDAKSAKAAGLYFIASLESGLRTRDDFAGYSVDAFMGSFQELADAIDTINKVGNGSM